MDSIDEIRQPKSVSTVVTTHKNADFDALAAMIAATLLYPGAVPVVPVSVNPNVKAFLSIHKDVLEVRRVDEIDLDAVRRLIVVDVNRWGRLDGMNRLRERDDLEIILWDHHPDPGDIAAHWTRHEAAGATVTLMVREMRERGITPSPIQATLFLAGLHEDTGHLMFPTTTPEDARAAAWLMENHADLGVIGSLLRPVYGQEQKTILFEMLKSEDRRKINGYTVSFHVVEIEGHVGSLSVVVQMCREILNVDAVFAIFTGKKRGKSIIIGRSNSEDLNVGAIMRRLGGGGHPGAGAAQLDSVNPEAVEEMITELIRGDQQASVQVSDIMSFPVFTIPSDTPMSAVKEILMERDCMGVPVVDGERLVGVISRRDFSKVRKESALKAPVRAFMSREVKTIAPGSSPMAAAKIMVKHDIGRLPVVEDGKIIGIVTRSDAMRYFYDLLPD